MTLDYGTASRAAQLVERLTSTGENDVDCKLFDEIENICKKSSIYIDRVHALLFHQLKEKHSQIRLSALRICNRLFKKFEHFRKLIIIEISVLLKLTVNTDAGRTLPPPKKFAADLEVYSIRCIKEWNDEFGKDFKDEFNFVFKYLSKYKKIDFESMTVQSVTNARLLEDREQRQRRLNDEKLKKIESEINELEPEITIASKTLESGLELLIPTPEEFFIPEAEEDILPTSNPSEPSLTDSGRKIVSEIESGDENERCRETGIIDPAAHTVTVTLRPDFRKRVKKSEDNLAIIESVNEQVKLISDKYLPKIKKWLQDIAKISNGELLKRTIELKRRLTDLAVRENKITYYEDDNDCSSDSDMEEVLPQSSADHLLAQCLAKPDNNIRNDGSDRADSAKVSGRDDNRNSVVAVPKLPFDIDLYHWEDEQLSAPRILPTNPDGHRFWTSSSIMDTDCDGIVLPGGSESLRTRVIEFTGKFERVDRQCRAPLPSGRLCPREDRFKCPFHGRIVLRDELGRVVDPENKIILEKEKKQNVPDWQDPQLLRDIKLQTGVDLTMPKKGSRKNRKQSSNLTNLKKELDTPRARLEKKVFKKSSVKKVAKILDGMDQRKFRDKFGDQFNYVHDTA
ncbi:UV-stimulated scaffold protein A-like isoform X2 [Myzus persicae]|uniref:UV-stimulated scaffold protein A-like isoform X2 n=1 Tax=Myzus persicae TaxID=13164 RepID=UPI000B930820|nr:UV-stimulated scaffold protein A-like isoform X2 [Myzus persicae]